MLETQDKSAPLEQEARIDVTPNSSTAYRLERFRKDSTIPFCQYRNRQDSHLKFQHEQD
jgi:hypothetical protein